MSVHEAGDDFSRIVNRSLTQLEWIFTPGDTRFDSSYIS